MAESFPVDGTGGFTISDWAAYFASSDGAVECYTADALALTRVDSGNICRLSAGALDAYMTINGYRLRIPAGSTQDLTAPAPSSGTVTYYVVAYYDPSLNVANSDGTAPRPLGACRFGLYASTDISTAMTGKFYVLMYSFSRAVGQALSAVMVTSWMRWLGGPTMDWDVSDTVPAGQSAYPRGTMRAEPSVGKLVVRSAVNATDLGWVDLLNSGPFAFPAASAYVSRYAAPSAPQYFIHSGVMVKCRGALKRSDDKVISSGNDATLGTFPAGLRPLFTERLTAKVGPGKGYVEVQVNPDGTIVMTGDSSGITWIDLSSLTWRREQ